MPLHSYVLAARIAEAKRLLLTTDWPIKVIADRLAFRDVYYFSRQFRQRVGLPPAKFRRDGAI